MLALSAPIAAIGGLSIKAAIDFESGFAGVRKTVDATEEEFRFLSKGIRNMALDIPVATGELNRIAESAGQLGIETESILDFTKVIADMAVTTNLTADAAATAFARIANITRLPQTEFQNLGSVVVDLGNNLATTEQEIVSFGLRIAGAGEIAGLSQAQILAIGGAMSSVGIEAQAGGTAVQKVLIAMTQAVATTNEDLKTFASVAGVSAADFASAFRDDAGLAFTEFVEGLGRSGTEAFGILEELGLQDQRLIRSFLSLGNAGTLLRESIELGSAAFAENSALIIEAEKRYATTEAQFQLLQNQFKDVAITIGNALLPSFKAMMDVVAPIVQGIGDWVERNPALTKGIIASGFAIAGLGTALIGLSLAMPGIAALVGALSALRVLTTGPLGIAAVAAAIAAGGAALLAIKSFDKGGRVAEDQIAQVHKGEIIIPEKIARNMPSFQEGTLPVAVPQPTGGGPILTMDYSGVLALESTIPVIERAKEELANFGHIAEGVATGLDEKFVGSLLTLNLSGAKFGDVFAGLTAKGIEAGKAFDIASLQIGLEFSESLRHALAVMEGGKPILLSLTQGVIDQQTAVDAIVEVYGSWGNALAETGPLVESTKRITEGAAQGMSDAMITSMAAINVAGADFSTSMEHFSSLGFDVGEAYDLAAVKVGKDFADGLQQIFSQMEGGGAIMEGMTTGLIDQQQAVDAIVAVYGSWEKALAATGDEVEALNAALASQAAQEFFTLSTNVARGRETPTGGPIGIPLPPLEVLQQMVRSAGSVTDFNDRSMALFNLTQIWGPIIRNIMDDLAIGFQHGGLVTRPTLAMIGEAGPELVVPLGRAGGGQAGGGNTIVLAPNIHDNIIMGDLDMEEMVVDALQKAWESGDVDFLK